ncbi:MAG: hypothetical protein HEEMFOPI_00590 [Holosporales bacterium]
MKFFLSLFFITSLYSNGISLLSEHLKKAVSSIDQETSHKEQKKEASKSLHPASINLHFFYLSSIVYCDKDHWTIWLNDEQISPHQKEHLDMDLVVFQDYIKINHKDSSKSAYTLKPHQTIDLKAGKIYCGDVRERLEKIDQKSSFTEGEDFDLG